MKSFVTFNQKTFGAKYQYFSIYFNSNVKY